MKPWMRIALGVLTGYWVRDGKTAQADLLKDAIAAEKKGKNIDAEMTAAAAKWEANGEPTIEEITAARKAIQARVGG